SYRLSVGSKKSNPQSYSSKVEFSTAQSISVFLPKTMTLNRIHSPFSASAERHIIADIQATKTLKKQFDHPMLE
ncbi:MAG: hypothetical protein WCI51_20930, partial [Lentisphaerota bacterium]